ncbi:MAG: hypothetical protein V1836_01970 [Candidatus Aenigmatarchaeota archaeon]
MKNGWKIYVFEHDPYSSELAESLQLVFGLERRSVNVTYGDNRKQIINKVKKAINGDHERILTVLGHGYAHKMTYGLCKHVADSRSDGYVYYHFDQHGDIGHIWTRITHGGFVARLFNDTKAQDVVFSDEPDFNSRALARGLDVDDTGASLMTNKNVPDAYCSFDLDCMRYEEIKTGWPGGTMHSIALLNEVENIKTKKDIISADVLGYSGERDAKSHVMYAVLMETLIGGGRVDEFKSLHEIAKNGRIDYQDMLKEFKSIGSCGR